MITQRLYSSPPSPSFGNSLQLHIHEERLYLGN
jgi:hypothetical protein